MNKAAIRETGFRAGCVAAFFCLACAAFAGEWRQYNGPLGNRASDETVGPITWSQAAPPAPVWKVPTINGFSSFTKSGNRVFTLVSRQVAAVWKEHCVALDASTGQELWAFPMCNASYDGGGDSGTPTNRGGDGPRSTPACDDTRVYTCDARLNLYCLAADTGQVVWSKNLVAEYAGRNITWQNAASPLLEGEAVLVAGGGAGQSLLAFDRTDGHLLWKAHDQRMTHATPVAATIQGVRQVIFFLQSGLFAVAPDTGAELWRYAFPYNTSTAASPVVSGDYVFCSAGYNVGAGVCRITWDGAQWQAVEVWRDSSLSNHWSSSVCYNGYVFGLFGESAYGTAALRCIELATGVPKWSRSGFGMGGVILAGDKLVVLADYGDIAVVEAASDAYREVARARVLAGKCWSTPVLSGNKIFARSTLEGVSFVLSQSATPTCSVGAPSSLLTSTGPVDFSVTFSEAVTGFDSTDDLQVNATGTAAGTVEVVAGSGAGPYTVRLSALTGDGTLGITVKAGACTNGTGGANAASEPSAVFTLDTAPPQVGGIELSTATISDAGPVDFFVTFTEPVTGFDSADDLRIDATDTAAAGTVEVVDGSGAGPYTVRLSNLTGTGALGITVKAAACIDGAGNGNPVDTASGTFAVDNTTRKAGARFSHRDYK